MGSSSVEFSTAEVSPTVAFASEPAVAEAATVHVAAVAEALPSHAIAVAARDRVQAQVLKFSRDFRRPKTFMGYIGFILLGLCKHCLPCTWEGDCKSNLLEVFVP